jgi:Ras-related protein Rab-1A
MREVKVEDKLCKMQLWDTAGQERFRSITAAYYKGAALIVLVFDITSIDSFTAIPGWIKGGGAFPPPSFLSFPFLI